MTDSDTSVRETEIVALPYAGRREAMTWRSLRGTPYAELKDSNGATILTLAVTPKGYVVHLNRAVAGLDLAPETCS